jgi:hypothetical protein
MPGGLEQNQYSNENISVFNSVEPLNSKYNMIPEIKFTRDSYIGSQRVNNQ